MVDRRFERLDPADLDAADQPGLVNGRGRDDDPPQATTRERRDHRQHTGNRADLAAQRQLTDEGEPPATWLDLFRTQQDPDRHRQVERGTGLAQVRRREVDRDPARRMDEARVPERTADALARFLERGIGQPDDREAGQAGCDIDLDADQPAVEAVEGR